MARRSAPRPAPTGLTPLQTPQLRPLKSLGSYGRVSHWTSEGRGRPRVLKKTECDKLAEKLLSDSTREVEGDVR